MVRHGRRSQTSVVSDFVDLPAGRMVNNAMPTPPQPPSRPIASAPPTPPSARQPVSAAPVAAEAKLPAGPATTPPRSKGQLNLDQRSGLDQRILRAAGSFDVLLRNGQTWSHVRLLDMDTWSLLIET